MLELHNREHAGQRRVLIVDDDVDFAASLTDLLELRGYVTAAAHSSGHAIAVLAEFHPAVAMIDIRLGRECGVDVLPRLLAQRPELICIMITAHADMPTAVSALRLGAYDYYEKSLDPAELYAILDRAFEKGDLLRQTRESGERLREQKLQLDTALNNMSQGLCMFDAAGAWLSAMRVIARYTACLRTWSNPVPCSSIFSITARQPAHSCMIPSNIVGMCWPASPKARPRAMSWRRARVARH